MQQASSRLACAALLFASFAAHAAKPAIPVVTVGAEFKQLQFDVEPVSGASYYELWFLPNGGASWVKWTSTLAADPLFKVNISAHLLDWFNARYRVTACNADGCATTANIAVTSRLKETVGFFKPRSAAVDPRFFGLSSTMSKDGKTLVVLGGEKIGPRVLSLTTYVYEKAGAGWRLAARLYPSPVEASTAGTTTDWQGRQVAVNADGTAIVFGVPNEFVLTPNSPEGQGAIYVFRKAGATWGLEQKLTPPDDRFWQYGEEVDLDDAGQTLAFNSKFADDSTQWRPRVAIYRHGASGWTLSRMLPESTTQVFIGSFDLSGDGKVLVRTIGTLPYGIAVDSGPDFSNSQVLMHIAGTSGRTGTVATNYDGSVIATGTSVSQPPAGADWNRLIMAFRRSGATWVAEPKFTYLSKTKDFPFASGSFADSLAVSDDGQFIAAGDVRNDNPGTGSIRLPFSGTTVRTGAVLVFERKPTSWALRMLLKPNVATENAYFGNAVSFTDGNRTLAVSSIGNSSKARDIDGDQADTSAPDSGAVWLY